MKAFHMATWALLIIGGLNWGLEIFGYGVGQYLGATLANIVYALVALSALYELLTHKKNCKVCSAASSSMPMAQ
jgi:uncharacterized membrane protein YuzA (DUF378 family)